MKAGITLIETILYMALLSVLIMTVMPILTSLTTFQSQQDTLADSVRDYSFIEATIRNLMNGARSIRIPAEGNLSNELRLVDSDGVEVKIRQSEDAVVYSKGEDNPIPLNAPLVHIKNVYFSRTESSHGFGQVLSNMTLNNFNFGTTSFLFRQE